VWTFFPTYLSADHDPRYRFHQGRANLRILNIREIKTVPYVPRSHPIIERLIGTVRRECLDRMLFWTAADLEFQQYLQRASYACGAGRAPADAESGRGRRSGEPPSVSVAVALPRAVSHAYSRMTQSIRSVLTAAVCDFATLTRSVLATNAADLPRSIWSG
jgi:hypothetical protein